MYYLRLRPHERAIWLAGMERIHNILRKIDRSTFAGREKAFWRGGELMFRLESAIRKLDKKG